MTFTHAELLSSLEDEIPGITYIPRSAHLTFEFDPHLYVDKKAVDESRISITRGATKRMHFVGTGEWLNSKLHRHEPICSVEITHGANGKVSVICRDLPFDCELEGWSTFQGIYTSYTSIVPNKKVHLRVCQRSSGVYWTLKFIGRNYRLIIHPGETLIVTHTVG